MSPKNAFWVLGVSPDATPGEIEREGRKVLGLLEIGAESAKTYTCPFGELPRDATMVREAMAALRDPKRRAKERCLAKLGSGPRSEVEDMDAPLADAFLIGGYRGL